jgi:cytochrome c biogenesis protein CcmG, thiol:disulfide interchange protein DsbE
VRRAVPLACALGLFACAQRAPPPPYAGNAISSGEISVSFPRYPDGEPFTVASERGNVVLLDVWATWCEPCLDSLPLYEQFSRQYVNQGLKVYALSLDEDLAQVAKFVAKTKISLPILLDKNGEVAERVLRVRQVPTSFLIDRKGVIRHVHEAFSEEYVGVYQREIEQLLAEKP